jgi:hypothetical protein
MKNQINIVKNALDNKGSVKIHVLSSSPKVMSFINKLTDVVVEYTTNGFMIVSRKPEIILN